MRELIENALKHSRADYTEIRIEEKEASRVVFRGKELETAGSTLDRGGVVRCLIRSKGWGVVTFNDLTDLLKKVEQAFQCAAAMHSEKPIEIAPAAPVQEIITVPLAQDFRDVSLAEKKALVEGYNQIVLGVSDKIVDTQAVYADSFIRVIYANSEGTYLEEERPSIMVGSFAIARDGDNVQQWYEGIAGPFGFEFAQKREKMMETAGKRAVELLSAQPVKGGVYTVVINQGLAGIFIHEAFGHLSEADFIAQNPQAREMMVLGRRFGKPILNVFEDGSISNLHGSHKYDDEGTPTGKHYLIKDGILVGRLHSRETAALMGEKPTGNARAVSYRFAPIVRMTNTAIENGTTSFEDMIKDIKLGIYACEAYGGETVLENFSFSSGYAYMIRDGKLAEMVKDVILAGNLFTTLENIDAIGNDFKWDFTPGGCGKNRQFPLPVGMGAPHIRIQNVAVGGQ